MKLTWFFVLLFFLTLPAKEVAQQSFPYGICGTSVVSTFDVNKYMELLKKNDPEQYTFWLQKFEEIGRFNRGATETRKFWAFNFKSQSHYDVSATLKRTGNFTRIWVEDESWNNNYVNDAVLDELLNHLEYISGSNSINPNMGIIAIDTMLFGQPPNYDGDGIVDFLILDIKDNFDTTGTRSFIAGYFSPNDQTENYFSNESDLIYLDSWPGIYFNDKYRTDRVLSTTAHEFQHLIHYNYDQDEANWVNEGLSELASTYCGYGISFPGLFLDSTNVSLTTWDGKLRDYSRVNLWMLYSAEQLGLSFIRKLVENKLNSEDGFNAAMAQAGLNGSMAQVFSNWVIANLINDIEFDPRYGYQWKEARGLRANPTRIIREYPQNDVSGEVNRYACEYHQFRGKDSLQIDFYSIPYQLYWVVSQGKDYHIQIPSNITINVPFFTEDSSYILVLYSTTTYQIYRYSANAKYSLNFFELSYDDGNADIHIQFQGTAANLFEVPASNIQLESVRFWSGASDFIARIHVYEQTLGLIPGKDLIPPIETMVSTSDSWITVNLPEPVSGLRKGDNIFVGVEINEPEKSLGYDESNKTDKSYLKSNSFWRKLSDFQSENGKTFDGVWMIRAAFSGLTDTDSISLPVEIDTTFVLKGNFPNPYLKQVGVTDIRFTLPTYGRIDFVVYNVLGQKVVNLKNIRPILSGQNHNEYHFTWNGEGVQGSLPSGVYFYQLIYQNPISGTRKRSNFKKMIIIR